jgi:hypothetical protein
MAKEKLLIEPKLISDLTKEERKQLGRKVLNGTLKTAPKGTKIDQFGTLFFEDGSEAMRTGHGRGRKSEYEYLSAKDIAERDGTPIKAFDKFEPSESMLAADKKKAEKARKKEERNAKRSKYKVAKQIEDDHRSGRNLDIIDYDSLHSPNISMMPDIIPKEMLPKLRKDGMPLQKDSNGNYIIRDGNYVFQNDKPWVEDGYGKDDADEKKLTRLNQDLSSPDIPWKRDRTTSIVNGKTVHNANKLYNQRTPRQLQSLLSKVYDKRVYTGSDGSKYQLDSNGNKIPFKGKTGFLYGGTSKTDPNIVKFGYGAHGVLARYADKKDWKRYGNNKTKSKGYPSGPMGIDAKSAFMDWELPIDVAKGAEKYIHGNFNDIDSRIMFDDGTPESRLLRKQLGSGASEYYDRNAMGLLNAPTEPQPIKDNSELPSFESVPIEDLSRFDVDEAYNRSTLSDAEIARVKELEQIKDADRSFLEAPRDDMTPVISGLRYKEVPSLRTPLGIVMDERMQRDAKSKISNKKKSEDARQARLRDKRIANLTPIQRIRENLTSVLPAPIKYATNSLDDALTSGNRLRNQINSDGIGSTLQDVANGTMAELAAPFSKSSSQWWKDRLNNRDSEAGSIGKKLADEAMLGVAGGIAGKGIGEVYKRLKRAGEMYGHRIKKVANERGDLAMHNQEFVKDLKEQIGNDKLSTLMNPDKVVKIRDMDTLAKQKVEALRQKAYESMTTVPPRKSYLHAIGGTEPVARRSSVGDVDYAEKLSAIDKLKKAYRDNTISVKRTGKSNNSDAAQLYEPTSPRYDPTITRVVDALIHNTKRKLGNRGMLKANEDELSALYEKIGSLNKARKAQRNAWDKLPDQYNNAGAMAGALIGM